MDSLAKRFASGSGPIVRVSPFPTKAPCAYSFSMKLGFVRCSAAGLVVLILSACVQIPNGPSDSGGGDASTPRPCDVCNTTADCPPDFECVSALESETSIRNENRCLQTGPIRSNTGFYRTAMATRASGGSKIEVRAPRQELSCEEFQNFFLRPTPCSESPQCSSSAAHCAVGTRKICAEGGRCATNEGVCSVSCDPNNSNGIQECASGFSCRESAYGGVFICLRD